MDKPTEVFVLFYDDHDDGGLYPAGFVLTEEEAQAWLDKQHELGDKDPYRDKTGLSPDEYYCDVQLWVGWRRGWADAKLKKMGVDFNG